MENALEIHGVLIVILLKYIKIYKNGHNWGGLQPVMVIIRTSALWTTSLAAAASD